MADKVEQELEDNTMPSGNIFSKQRARAGLFLPFTLILLFGLETTYAGRAESPNAAPIQDCNTTASSVGFDLVLPIQAGGEQFQTGDWVYQTKGSDHTGKDSCALDLWDVQGMEVVSIADGKVVVAKWNNPQDPLGGYGYYVIVEHKIDGINYYSLYSHLLDPKSKNLPDKCKVAPAKEVKAGECVGISDATGHAIPPGFPHLHFAMWSGTGAFDENALSVAPENARGLKFYGTLLAHTKVTTMATAERDTWILPALSLKVDETQSRSYVFTNTSKINWDQSNKFEFVRVSGEAPGLPDMVSLNEMVEPGAEATITLSIMGTTPDYLTVNGNCAITMSLLVRPFR